MQGHFAAQSQRTSREGTNLANLDTGIPNSVDWGLLILRISFGLSLFLKHGWEKPTNFGRMAQHFPDPLHIGHLPTFLFALISDAVCSLLVIVGLATRWAALWSLINIFAAWSLVHHFQFFGRGADHGEAIVLYLAGFLTLAIIGPGKFSVDYLLKHIIIRRQS